MQNHIPHWAICRKEIKSYVVLLQCVPHRRSLSHSVHSQRVHSVDGNRSTTRISWTRTTQPTTKRIIEQCNLIKRQPPKRVLYLPSGTAVTVSTIAGSGQYSLHTSSSTQGKRTSGSSADASQESNFRKTSATTSKTEQQSFSVLLARGSTRRFS